MEGNTSATRFVLFNWRAMESPLGTSTSESTKVTALYCFHLFLKPPISKFWMGGWLCPLTLPKYLGIVLLLLLSSHSTPKEALFGDDFVLVPVFLSRGKITEPQGVHAPFSKCHSKAGSGWQQWVKRGPCEGQFLSLLEIRSLTVRQGQGLPRNELLSHHLDPGWPMSLPLPFTCLLCLAPPAHYECHKMN